LQAYGVLDKYKISKMFFVRTDQADCSYMDAASEEYAVEPITEKAKRPSKPKPLKPSEPNESTRSAIDLKDIDAKEEAKVEISDMKASLISDVPETPVEEPVQNVETVPERILKIAEAIKEEESGIKEEMEIEVKEDAVEDKGSEHSAEKAGRTV